MLALEEDMEVVFTAENGDILLEKLQHISCDVVLLDINMPGRIGNGLDAARFLKSQYPELKIIFLTVNNSRNAVRESKELGALAFIMKDDDLDQVIHAVPSTIQNLARNESIFQLLKESDIDYLRLLIQDIPQEKIADILQQKPEDLMKLERELMHNLNVKSSSELINLSRELGIENTDASS